MDETLEVLKVLARRTLGILACERIVPIYTSTIYTGACGYSVKAFAWTTSSLLVIAFAGMLMLTLRSALWEVKHPAEEQFYGPLDKPKDELKSEDNDDTNDESHDSPPDVVAIGHDQARRDAGREWKGKDFPMDETNKEMEAFSLKDATAKDFAV